MGLIEDIRQKIKEYEQFKEDFSQDHEKKLIMTLFVAELKILEKAYFDEQ